MPLLALLSGSTTSQPDYSLPNLVLRAVYVGEHFLTAKRGESQRSARGGWLPSLKIRSGCHHWWPRPPAARSEFGLGGVLPGLGAFLLFSCSAFEATIHDEAHDAFMTLPPYTTRGREGEVPQLSPGPKTCRLSVCVRKCPPFPHGWRRRV